MRQDLLTQIEALKASRQAHAKIAFEVLKAAEQKVYAVDFVALGVLHRSIALIDGFTRMVEEKNALCANALLRLQLDNIIRFYAFWLVDDPDSLVLKLLEGGQLNKEKSKNGRLLTDAYLVSEAEKLYPWLKSVYEETSGFIHLSDTHLYACWKALDNGQLSMEIGMG